MAAAHRQHPTHALQRLGLQGRRSTDRGRCVCRGGAEQAHARPAAGMALQRHGHRHRDAKGLLGQWPVVVVELQQAAVTRPAFEHDRQRGRQIERFAQGGEQPERGPGGAHRRLQPGQRAAEHGVELHRRRQRQRHHFDQLQLQLGAQRVQPRVGRCRAGTPVRQRVTTRFECLRLQPARFGRVGRAWQLLGQRRHQDPVERRHRGVAAGRMRHLGDLDRRVHGPARS